MPTLSGNGLVEDRRRLQELVEDPPPHGHLEDVSRDEYVFNQGDEPGWIGFVLEGVVSQTRLTRGGDKITFNLLGPGETLGFHSLELNCLQLFGARALKDTSLYRIETASGNNWRESLQDVLSIAHKHLHFRTVELMERLVTKRSHVLIDQLTCELIKLGSRFGLEEADSGSWKAINVPLKRKVLARLVGAPIESTIRKLGELRQRDLIDTGREKIMVQGLPPLQSTIRERCRDCFFRCTEKSPVNRVNCSS